MIKFEKCFRIRFIKLYWELPVNTFLEMLAGYDIAHTHCLMLIDLILIFNWRRIGLWEMLENYLEASLGKIIENC